MFVKAVVVCMVLCTVMNEVPAENSAPPCACPLIYDPVCSGGISYASGCNAACNGVSSYTIGQCTQK